MTVTVYKYLLTMKQLLLFVYLIIPVDLVIKTKLVEIETDKTITDRQDKTVSIQTRSVIECTGRCHSAENCRISSYNDQNQTCLLNFSDGFSVDKKTSIGSVAMIVKALPIRECCDLPSTSASGIYTVYPTSSNGFNVYCDMETDGGGWTVFQRRVDGSVDFYRDWDEYEDGFGDLLTEFWLGNEKIHKITSHGTHKLRIDLEDFDGNVTYAKYSNFRVDDSTTNYTVIVKGYGGTAGDSFFDSDGYQFSTLDRDNDAHSVLNCAQWANGAWWYSACHRSNLNGQYLAGDHTSYGDGINWLSWKGYRYSLKSTKMMMRKHN